MPDPGNLPPGDFTLAAVEAWCDALPRIGGGPAKGSLAVGLVILERLKTSFELNIDSHMAEGGAQIQGASGAAVRRILESFGETRPFAGEGGRTNRGTPKVASALLAAIASADISRLPELERAQILHSAQGILVDRVREFHNRERLKPSWDPAARTRSFVGQILAIARETGKYGPVAQYLVGAKLQLRFPEVVVRNESYSAPDQQTGQPGDFVVGDTAFHVTVAPTTGHFEKCVRNLRVRRRGNPDPIGHATGIA